MSHLGTMSGSVLVFGGPYSNVQATLAIRAEAERLGIPSSRIICNGDLVAYCADPEDTVNLIREWGVHVVMGNCEESIAANSDDCGCGFEDDTMCSVLSREWYSYTKDRISEPNRLWMRTLPRLLTFKLGGKKFSVVHGSPNNISEFVFASSDSDEKRLALDSMESHCIIGGHCGIPFGEQVIDASETATRGASYWLNTGVIGMPANDGTRDGWYMLLDETDGDVFCSWHRLPFDSEAAARSMKQAGLGAAYRDALLSGRWPSLDVLPDAERSRQGQRIEIAPLALV